MSRGIEIFLEKGATQGLGTGISIFSLISALSFISTFEGRISPSSKTGGVRSSTWHKTINGLEDIEFPDSSIEEFFFILELALFPG